MKNILLILILFFFLPVRSQELATAEEWREDLKFLQENVHRDYSFLFKKTTIEEFDTKVDQLYSKIPEMQEHEIITGLARLVASFGYGHTELGWRGDLAGFHRLPVTFYQFSDGVFVREVSNEYENILGARLTAVEGMPIDKVLIAIYPVVPAENEQYFKAYGLNFITVPEILHAQGVMADFSSTVSFTFEKDGKQFKQKISSLPKGEKIERRYGFSAESENWLNTREKGENPLFLKHLEDKIYYYEYLPEQKTVYIRHSQIQDDPSESIPEFYDRVFNFIEENEVEKLVLDVRLNGGGNNYKNKPIVTGIIKSDKINRPGHFFVILGRRTFSACQNLVNELDNYTNAIFIGEPTAENINFYGDTKRLDLPNSGIPVYLSFAWWQDKPQWENDEWLEPHIPVEMSFEDYRTNRDPVLETALNFSDTTFVRDPMGYLTVLFFEGKIEKVMTEAARMVNDPNYAFFKFEEQFNNTAYRLLASERVEEAIFVFQMNTELFPESANAWNSLAEAYLKAGNKEKAVEFYKKAVQLDPEGNTGDHAKNMLKNIKTEN